MDVESVLLNRVHENLGQHVLESNFYPRDVMHGSHS